MEYKRFNDKIVLRLDAGDEIGASIKKIAQEEKIKTASIQGIGGADRLLLGVFDEEKKEYKEYEYSGTHEITSIMGNITFVDGEVYTHIHINGVGDGGKAIGGHLISCTISLTSEIVIDIIQGVVSRRKNEKLGINELSF